MLRYNFIMPISYAYFYAYAAAAPSFTVAGSYFPAWLVFIFAAIFITILIRMVLIRIGIDDAMRYKLVVYSALALALCFAALWLFFGG